MKKLIQKELRENLKLAVPGLLIFSALLASSYAGAVPRPSLNRNVLAIVELFCNALGLALGWLQIHHERHRDLWAFLVHRPLTRSEIFFAKVVAGLGLYSFAAGLPLLVWVAASAMPGQFAAPFEWAMALPIVATFLTGVVWYFAGMLTGLRQARWHASRGLGLVAALFIYMLSGVQPPGLPGFWQQFVVVLIGGMLLAVAAWGAFQGDGSDRSQTVWGRRALSATLAVAVVFICFGTQVLIEAVLLRGHRSDSTYSEIMQDGTICRVIQRTGQSAEIVDLAGAPLKDPDTGRKMTLAHFDKLVAESYPINVEFGNQSELRNSIKPDTRFFSPCQTIDRVHWYWTRNGELTGYDTATRRFVGSILPDHFPTSTARFLRPQIGDVDADEDSGQQNGSSLLTLATPLAVCRVNLENRTTRVLLSTTNGDAIGGARNIGDEAFVAVTRNSIEMMTMDGKSLWKVPYQSAYPDSMWVKVSRLAAPQEFAVWTGQYFRGNRQNRVEGRGYSQVLFVSGERGLIKKVDLTATIFPQHQKLQALSWRVGALLLPPIPIFYQLLGWQRIPQIQVEISLAMAAVCAVAGWSLGRRYHFPGKTQAGWAVFHVLCGLPGFIAFLCVQQWPAREACPHCKKLRLVDRARCEHCNAGFAPPEKNGTEIFEPLTANQPLSEHKIFV